MTDSEITTTILRQIRDEIVTTRTELKAEIKQVNDRLEVTNQRLDVVEHVLRDTAGQIVMLTGYVKNKHDADIKRLEKRVARLEKKVG